MNDQSRKKGAYKLILLPSGRQGEVASDESVLDAARSLGVEIESICGGRQTCGKCLIEVETGTFDKHGVTSRMSNLSEPEEAERAYAEEHKINLNTQRLSCAARIMDDVVIHIPIESQARKQVIRKEASDLALEVNPAVRLHYVETEQDTLGGSSDWDRLKDALKEQWNLDDLSIDLKALQTLHSKLLEGNWTVTVTVWQDRDILRIEPGYVESLYGLAIDIGSTTVACYLCDLRTGEVRSTVAMMNPQIRFGEDLMSRVSYAMKEPQGVLRMNKAIIKAINELCDQAAGEAGIQPDEITDIVMVGNTVMHHLLLGIDPTPLGGSPFTLSVQDALDVNARDLNIKNTHPGAKAHILPCIAGHVGADNVGVLLAEQPSFDDQISLIVDIGTNAEILLGRESEIYSASSPTGPAFEGAQITHGQRAAPGAIERVRIDKDLGSVRYRVVGDERWSDELGEGESLQPTGICGSGIIEVVAELFLAGLIDQGGLFRENAAHQSPAVRYNGRTAEIVIAHPEGSGSQQEIIVTQNDIRAIQLAKGALYAGVRLLMDHMGVDHVDRIKLAGAFGSYIDPKYAMIIGMIPDCDLDQVQSIGNAAGDGARIALLNREQRDLAARAAREVHYVETAVEPAFQEYFVDAMVMPHARDKFEHIEDLLSTIKSSDSRPSRRRRKHSDRT
jgi:uncharacterized 2Fe-2S/4Fe-4S cluster protein (DUF4445 family)